ncbi:NAD(P)/FAD-dependent oxidoreductase [Streptosporangium roseum]|uniref:FAD-dependent pyridine nucleotide-disulphide oxidoreductase n=1 Tax=Streptosporangium roseum (strain ATCC 12428 / DSM 43021 / JCM 3005 / KCTC 9067 / NCIMB 10171 / NRRL 2505 / NI 9100) TaxID=479432 RepID=D2AU56_STRRD|nr:FAD-dependent oxidoreductase [Streptosporangium roseum]ACZ90511.1 FAD-dependent pyridine nucleotide-disulphide oxidoreductase [Streptosporangium roseum DSM 43021]
MTTDITTLTPDVVIVGAGPSGLSAARELAPRLGGGVLVLDRESTAGGIPRHSDHPGYGIRDMRRFMSGPAYARRLVEQAEAAGATIRTDATVTGWAGDHAIEATTPQGRIRVEARAVVLATGARERPRPARLIPGDRARGVYTTGHLQNLVHLRHGKVGKRAVIVGAELVSWSAALTLREAGCRTVLMTTEYPRPDSYALFSVPGRILFRTRVATRTRVTRIIGRPALEAVEVENVDTGERRVVECDTLILTGDWIPDHELARAAGITLDPGTKGPLVDSALRTDRPGVFAVGNMLHPVDTADIAAIDGAHVARSVIAWLNGERVPAGQVRLVADAPFRWVSPEILRPGDPVPSRRRLLLWSDRYIPFPQVVLRQGGKVVARRRLWWPAAPGRVFRVPTDILSAVDPKGGTVHIGIR